MNRKLQSLINLVRFLYAQRIKGFAPPGDVPLMDEAGIARFQRELARASRYVEFGSGGSTVLVDRAGIPAISVENDRFYARAVASRLGRGAVRQIVVPMGLTREWGYPLWRSTQAAWRYVSAPWGEGPGEAGTFPDLVLVDGRYRVACALEAARRAHAAGASATLMFDDYTPRAHYRAVEEYLGQPELDGRAALFRIGQADVPETAVLHWLRDPA
jgi:hypothetical protein